MFDEQADHDDEDEGEPLGMVIEEEDSGASEEESGSQADPRVEEERAREKEEIRTLRT